MPIVRRTAIPVLAFIALGWAWAWASPVGASPDESFHLTSSWCAWGDHEACITSGDDLSVTVPRAVGAQACFVMSAESASCVEKRPFDDQITTTRINEGIGGYPPLFYATMRIFVGPDIDRSVVVMRMFNVVLAGGFLLWALLIASPVVRRAVAASWAIGIVPIGIYYIASVNPSGWAVIAGGTFWAFALSLAQERSVRSRRGVLALTGAVSSATVGLLARSDQFLTIIVSLAVVLVLQHGAIKRKGLAITFGVGVVVAIALALLFRVGSYLSVREFMVPVGNDLTNQPNPLVRLVTELPAFLAGHVGFKPSYLPLSEADYFGVPGWVNEAFVYGLGSYDVGLPSAVSVLMLLALGVVLAAGLAYAHRRTYVAIGVVILGIVGLILAQRALAGWGSWENMDLFFWYLHPRYTLPLVMVGLGVFLVVQTPPQRLFGRAQAGFAAGALVLATVAAFLALVTRYSLGEGAAWMTLDWTGGWWWQFGPPPIALAAIVLIAGAVYFPAMLTFRAPSRLPAGKGPGSKENQGHSERDDQHGDRLRDIARP